ncbi:MAG: tyrosine-type recombinase/integrase [Polyangia bacterium]
MANCRGARGRSCTAEERSATPKGRTRRTVPMTATLVAALKRLSVVRTGFVVRNADGMQVSDGVCCKQIRRICRRAGLPERGWHVLRHSFGTHAAMFGVNPSKLMTWMGHKRIDETMLYVNFAGNHIIAGGPEPTPIDETIRRVAILLAELQTTTAGVFERSEGELNVVFHLPGRLTRPSFPGLRTAKFSRKHKTLMVQVAVPEPRVRDCARGCNRCRSCAPRDTLRPRGHD